MRCRPRQQRSDRTIVNLRSFEVPTVVKHAPGALAHLADEIKQLGVRRPLLVTDKGLVNAGLVDEAVKVLKAGNVDHVLFDGVVPNPPIALVDRGAAIYRSEGCDGLIGLGGGSPMMSRLLQFAWGFAAQRS